MSKKNIIITATVRSGHNFVRSQLESWDTNNDFLIGNFEDALPKNYLESRDKIPVGGKLLNYRYPIINIVVTRDLLNWFASYLFWMIKASDQPYNSEKFNYAIEIWKQMAQEAFGITEYIPYKYRIVYDQFRTDQEVRKWACYFIGGSYNEDRLDLVPEAGGGSSFDKRAVRGSKMRTDLRWKQILKSSLASSYRELLHENKDSLILYKRYFKLTESQQTFLKSLW